MKYKYEFLYIDYFKFDLFDDAVFYEVLHLTQKDEKLLKFQMKILYSKK